MSRAGKRLIDAIRSARGQSPTTGLSDRDQLLVRILAEGDLVFLPMRRAHWGTNAPTNAYFGRRHFRGAGIPWRGTATNAGERMATSRLLDATDAAGFITIKKLMSVRWTHVRLTDAGEDHARELVGLPDLDAARALTARLLQLTPKPGAWISELALADQNYDGRELALIEDMAMPAMYRGWIEVHSDINGHARYRVTEACADPGDIPDPKEHPDPVPEAVELYHETLSQATVRLTLGEREDTREIAPMPLSIGEPTIFPAWFRPGP